MVERRDNWLIGLDFVQDLVSNLMGKSKVRLWMLMYENISRLIWCERTA